MSILSIIALMIIGFVVAHNKWQGMALRNGYMTSGKVIDFQPEVSFFNGGTQHTHEYPIVEYLDSEGQLKSDQMNTFNRIGKYKLGDEIKIIQYENKIHHKKSNRLLSLVIVATGIFVLLVDNL